MLGNPAEFIQPSSWTPSAALNPVSERDIERGAINACLAARNDFHLHSVACRNNVRALDHQNHSSFRRACTMAHASRNNKALSRRKLHYAIFEIDQEPSIQHEK